MQNAAQYQSKQSRFDGVRRRRRLACLPVLGLLVLAGCRGSDGPERVVVDGQATYLDQPIANGQIYFYPTEGTQGPVSGGPVKDGRYRAKARGGVPVGTHRVEITAYRALPAAPGATISEGTPPEQYLPAKFNTHSELTVKIDGSEDPTTHDFHLTK